MPILGICVFGSYDYPGSLGEQYRTIMVSSFFFLRSHLQKTGTETTLLIVQCDSGNIHGPLVACARYCVLDEYQKVRETMQFPLHVVFIIQLPRIAGFHWFPGR